MPMRMHRKSHLDERLAKCANLTIADVSEKNMKAAAGLRNLIDFNAVFGNDNAVHLEIGCGKGRFACELAKRRPDIDIVAVEKISNVLIEACESAEKEGISNLHFLNCAAEVLPRYIPEGSVERIYLNFSNPLPKLGYAKQRLTHPRFLQLYKGLLKQGGTIVQKTDDGDFYRFSLESFMSCGFEIVQKCEDLAALGDADNIVTEHEQRFMDMGKNIYRIVCKVK